jgi:GMP synthase-like glutamine amidotransferase
MINVLVIQNNRYESLGVLEGLFDYKVIYADEGESIPSIKGYNALIILGGPASAYDNYAYLRREEELIKEAIKNNIPTLGICLGSQLIAKACNTRVYKGSKKEIGWHYINLHNSLFKLFNKKRLIVFQWHNDTFDLPQGAELLASSNSYPNQAFKIGSAVGVQFHLEVNSSMIIEWSKVYNEPLDLSTYYDNSNYAKLLWNYTLSPNSA